MGNLSIAGLGLILLSVVTAAGGQLLLKHGVQLATASSRAARVRRYRLLERNWAS
jgi:hypothetical protein